MYLKEIRMTSANEKINYVEFPAVDILATKAFFSRVFGWTFEDFGQNYTAFSNQGLDGGFFTSDKKALTETGSALIVFYSADLDATLSKVSQAGGLVSQEIFSFPGGRRFHFIEPSGNELGVWTDISL